MIDKIKQPLITIVIGLVVMFLQKFLPMLAVAGFGILYVIGAIIAIYGVYLLVKAIL